MQSSSLVSSPNFMSRTRCDISWLGAFGALYVCDFSRRALPCCVVVMTHEPYIIVWKSDGLVRCPYLPPPSPDHYYPLEYPWLHIKWWPIYEVMCTPSFWENAVVIVPSTKELSGDDWALRGSLSLPTWGCLSSNGNEGCRARLCWPWLTIYSEKEYFLICNLWGLLQRTWASTRKPEFPLCG